MMWSASHIRPQPNHAQSALSGVCSVGGRLILHGGRAHGPYFTEIKCDGRVCLKNKPLTSRGVAAVEPRPTMWGEARPTFRPKYNHAKSALRGARAPWAVGSYSTG